MKRIISILIALSFFSSVFSSVIVVNINHGKASDEKGNGSYKKPYKTISKAAGLAVAGDTVLVYGGIYREWVAPENSGTPANPVVFKAAPGERVIIKGSEVWEKPWQRLEGSENVHVSKLDVDKLKDYNPFYISLARMEGRLSLGQIFVNGEHYMQVDSLEEVRMFSGTWMMSYDSTEIILHFEKEKSHLSFGNSMVEYTARERIFSPHKRGLSYITVEGFTLEHAANQFPSGFYRRGEGGHPQVGALSTRAGHHWTIRNNTIRYAKSLGIDCGYGGANDIPEGEEENENKDSLGYHLIEYNHIDFCGAGGIAGAWQHESNISYNVIENCNYLNHTAPETGGIKVHFFYNSIVEGNLLRNNNCNGIWLDNQWYGSRVTRNVVLESRGQGIFVELGDGECLVDNNIVAYTLLGDGIYLHDASGVTIANNLLFANEHFGFYARIVTERNLGAENGERVIAATKDLRILNNIFIDNYRGHICLPLEDGERITNNRSDYNLFIGGTQWQWEGLAHNSFTIGTNDKRISADSLALRLEKALQENDVPEAMQPNYNLWKNQPLLRLDWWRMLTGNDRHSFAPPVHQGEVENGAVAKGAFYLSPSNLFMDLKNGSSFNQMKAPDVKGVDHDFYGNKVNAGGVLPGPFQDYTSGFNRFVIIPRQVQ